MFWINLVLLALSLQDSGKSVTVGDLKISADHVRVSPASRELRLVGNVRVEHEFGAVTGESLVVNTKKQVATMQKLRWPVARAQDHNVTATASTGTYTRGSREIELQELRIVQSPSWLTAKRARYLPQDRATLVLDDVEGMWIPRNLQLAGRAPITFRAKGLKAALRKGKDGDWVVENVVLLEAELRADDGTVLRAASLRVDFPHR